jgi:hypothetical protein
LPRLYLEIKCLEHKNAKRRAYLRPGARSRIAIGAAEPRHRWKKAVTA